LEYNRVVMHYAVVISVVPRVTVYVVKMHLNDRYGLSDVLFMRYPSCIRYRLGKGCGCAQYFGKLFNQSPVFRPFQTSSSRDYNLRIGQGNFVGSPDNILYNGFETQV